MSNPFASATQGQDDKTSKNSAQTKESFQSGYQQALDDFAITPLLRRLKTFSDSNFDAFWYNLSHQEAEVIAAILIQHLIPNLSGKLLVSYLRAMRCPPSEVFQSPAPLHLPAATTDLSAAFPEVETPRFLYGDRLRWLSNGETTDWGIVVGRAYSFAPHRCRWQWCYLLWLEAESPSAAWIRSDFAWEDDLEPLEMEETL